MPFELPTLTAVRCVNANPRTELHGEERHRAIDLTFEYAASNDVLDAIAPGLREHIYTNRAADAAQETLPDVAIPLPDLRFPFLPTENVRWNQPKSRGYRWIWDWGRDEQHVDLTDVGMNSLQFSAEQGGTVTPRFTISYNGEELNDNTLYGELCGLAAMGDLHIQLFAPADHIPVKKGWRSGKADEPAATDGGAPLLDAQQGPGDDNHDDDDTGDQHPEGEFAEGSPEQALLDSATNVTLSDGQEAVMVTRGRRSKKAAVAA